MRHKQHRPQSLALLLVAAAFGIITSGCGKAELEEANRVLQAQLDSTKAAKEAAERLAAMREGKIEMSQAEIDALKKKVMDGFCAPMMPFDSTKTYGCIKTGKVPQTGTFHLRDDLTMQQGRCYMGLKVEGEGVMSCEAIDTRRAIEFMCNDWVCRDKAAPPTPM